MWPGDRGISCHVTISSPCRSLCRPSAIRYPRQIHHMRRESDTAEVVNGLVGERGEPQPELVGPHRRGAGAIRIEVELALFDPVLHLAAGAIELLVKRSGRPAVRLQGGDDEAGIGLTTAPFRLADDAPPPGPAIPGRPQEVTEHPLWIAGRLADPASFVEGLGD